MATDRLFGWAQWSTGSVGCGSGRVDGARLLCPEVPGGGTGGSWRHVLGDLGRVRARICSQGQGGCSPEAMGSQIKQSSQAHPAALP